MQRSVRQITIGILFVVFISLFGTARPALAEDCDVDADCNIDRDDISLITSVRNTPANGPDDPRDPDGDGIITVLDARMCVVRCAEPRCAVVPPSCTTAEPTDCLAGEWSSWSQCSTACGGGEQTRSRTIITEPVNGGVECPNLFETRTCNEQSCVEDNCFDNVDNNNNGLLDCADPSCEEVRGGECLTGLPGICAPGVRTCRGGTELCVQVEQPEGEICDGIDNDCDGVIDQGLTFSSWYRDSDADFFGDPNTIIEACNTLDGYVLDNTDCDDIDPEVNPGRLEIIGDDKDNDCNPDTTDQELPPPTPGSISGQVIDAVTGDFLVDLEVSLFIEQDGQPGQLISQYISGYEGDFQFLNLAPGSYVISGVSTGYLAGQRVSVLSAGTTLSRQDIVLSPELMNGEVRIVLTWGETPRDLEAHLTAPNPNGCRYHCYYWNKEIPGASLDLDDRHSYGPETITITQKTPGTFRYYIHDFSNKESSYSQALSQSGAEVRVYLNNESDPLIFTPPATVGTVWHVFDLDGETDGITPVNIMTSQEEPGRIDFPVITSNFLNNASWHAPYTYQVTAFDPDGDDSLTYSLLQGPPGMSIDPQTGLLQWFPAGDLDPSYEVSVQVADGRCGETTESHQLFVDYSPSLQVSVEPCSGYNPGGNITLNWSTNMAETVVIDQGIGLVSLNGSMTIPSPTEPTAYRFTAYNEATEISNTTPAEPQGRFTFSSGSIAPGQSANLNWDIDCANYCEIDHGIGEVESSGSLEITLPDAQYDPYTYSLSCTNGRGTRRFTADILVRHGPSPPAYYSKLNEETCEWSPGEPVVLDWSFSPVDNVTFETITIAPDIGQVEVRGGTMVVYPMEPIIYTITALGHDDTGQNATAIKQLTVPGKPNIRFSVSPERIIPGSTATLSWTTRCADTVSIDNGIGEMAPSGTITVSPGQLPATHVLTAVNERESVSDMVTIRHAEPTGYFWVDPAYIKSGENATLKWSTQYADEVSIFPDVGPVEQNGSILVTPEKSTSYVLSMIGPGGTARLYANVNYLRPMADIRATPETIALGESTTLSWVFSNADNCQIDQGIGVVELGGERIVSPTETTTYTITATSPDTSATDQVTVVVNPTSTPVPTVSLGADINAFMVGNTTNLIWSSTDADTVSIEPNIGVISLNGSMEISPIETTTYIITATGPSGTVTAEKKVTVLYPSPTVSMQTDSLEIVMGQSAVLTWSSTNSDTVSIEPGIGEVALNGSMAVLPNETTTYVITAVSRGGTTKTSRTISVTYTLPTVALQAEPLEIQGGQSVTLTWTSADADRVTIEPDIGRVSQNSTIEVSPNETTTYIITATGRGGNATAQAIILVTNPLPTVGVTVSQNAIDLGESAILTWETLNAVTIHLDNGTEVIPVDASGSLQVTPDFTTTYTIIAVNSLGREVRTSQDLAVIPPPLSVIILEPADGFETNQPIISVSGTYTGLATVIQVNGEEVVLDAGSFSIDSLLLSPGESEIMVTATDAYGQSAATDITVQYTPPFPVADIAVSRSFLPAGAYASLSWSCSGAETVTIDNNIGVVGLSGNESISPLETTTYTITATLGPVTTIDTVTVYVTTPEGAYSYGNPDHGEQTFLEYLNRARMNPVAEAARLGIDLNEGLAPGTISTEPVQPVTSNALLNRAARLHSVDLVNQDYFKIYSSEEEEETLPPQVRAEAQGYFGTVGENISMFRDENYFGDFAWYVYHNHDLLFLDENTPGRVNRLNILLADYKEMGIGTSSYPSEVPVDAVITCDFGFIPNTDSFLLGVIFDDQDNDGFYDAYEGLEGVRIELLGTDHVTVTANAGGYGLQVPPGNYTLRATLPNGRQAQEEVVIGDQNVKTDFTAADFIVPSPIVTAFNTSAQDVLANTLITLTWQTENGSYATLDDGLREINLALNGFMTISPKTGTTYTIVVTGPDGATQSAQLTINIIDEPLTGVAFRVEPQSIAAGGSSTLFWDASGADNVTITPDPGAGVLSPSGSVQVSPNETTTYILTAVKNTTTVLERVTLYVNDNSIHGDLTSAEQAHLEAINRARANPLAEAARLGIDLNEGLAPGTISSDPVQPLAFNGILLQTARAHSADMAERDYFAHNLDNEPTAYERMVAAGYMANRSGENLAYLTFGSPLDELESLLMMHDILFVDAGIVGRGHRLTILDSHLKEVGVGAATGSLDPAVAYGYTLTCDFGMIEETNPFLLGVVYDDLDGDGIYDAGEGMGGVRIEIEESWDEFPTMTAGGYAVELPPGDYTVIATLADGQKAVKTAVIDDLNVKLDFLQSEFAFDAPLVSIGADKYSILKGDTVTVSWLSNQAVSAVLHDGVTDTPVPVNGSTVLAPEVTTVYSITVTNPVGTATEQITIEVEDLTPTVSISAEPATIGAGGATILSWQDEYAYSVSIDNGIGDVTDMHSIMVTPEVTTTYIITAAGFGGTVTDEVIVTVEGASPISIYMVKPMDSEILTVSRAMVWGSVTNSVGNETGVSVNGYPAQVLNGIFVANNIPLVEGENTIYVVAHGADGSIATATRTVTLDTSGGEDWIELSMNPETGVTPFATKLTAEPHLTNALVSSSLVAPGAANPPTITQVSTTEYDLVFTSPGTYFLTYEGIDDQGVTHTRSIMVNVLDRDAFDALLQSKWDGMKAALANQDVAGAVEYFSEDTRELYSESFLAISDQLPQLASDMQDIQLIYSENDKAQYRIRRNEVHAGQPYPITYYIYFVKNENGLWKIYRY